MCTLVLLRRPHHPWPVLIGANRDEMASRPWDPPGRHWPDRADVIGGRDRSAGGSWLGVNDSGMVAAILNRIGTLGPAPGKRSRGELVLDALDHADAAQAAESLAQLDGRAYRPFNMVLADNRDAFWLRADGGPRVTAHPIAAGLHMISALDLDDTRSARLAHYLPRFAAAAIPDPAADDWRDWTGLLADGPETAAPEDATTEGPAMCFSRADGFGTVSSSLIALAEPGADPLVAWHFASRATMPGGYTRVKL